MFQTCQVSHFSTRINEILLKADLKNALRIISFYSFGVSLPIVHQHLALWNLYFSAHLKYNSTRNFLPGYWCASLCRQICYSLGTRCRTESEIATSCADFSPHLLGFRSLHVENWQLLAYSLDSVPIKNVSTKEKLPVHCPIGLHVIYIASLIPCLIIRRNHFPDHFQYCHCRS